MAVSYTHLEIGISTLIDSPYTTTKNTAAVAINGINTEKSIELDQKDWKMCIRDRVKETLMTIILIHTTIMEQDITCLLYTSRCV